MFLALRLISGANGLVTAVLVLFGMMTLPEFIAADWIIGLLLVGGALIPRRAWARSVMTVGNAYALGVFTVALARQMGSSAAASPLLLLAMAAAAAALAGLLSARAAS